jgi:hypothetical protein
MEASAPCVACDDQVRRDVCTVSGPAMEALDAPQLRR